MRELVNPKAPVTRGVTFLGDSWSKPTATTMSIADLTRASDLSFDFWCLDRYCSFCNGDATKKKWNTKRMSTTRIQTWNCQINFTKASQKQTLYLLVFLSSFSSFFIDADSLPSSPTWRHKQAHWILINVKPNQRNIKLKPVRWTRRSTTNLDQGGADRRTQPAEKWYPSNQFCAFFVLHDKIFYSHIMIISPSLSN